VIPLNKEQQQAIAFETNTWVSAGAGSGKTRTLVELYVRLLTEDGLSPERLVAMTFTEKAAAEMKDRIRDAIDERLLAAADATEAERWTKLRRELVRAPISTIHSFCAALLREHPAMARIDPAFAVLEEREAWRLLSKALENVILGGVQSEDPAVTRLVDLYGLAAGEMGGYGLIQAVAGLYAQMVQAGQTVAECRAKIPEPAELVAPALDELIRTLDDRVRTALDGSVKQRQDAAAFMPRWSDIKMRFAQGLPPDLSLKEVGRLERALKGRRWRSGAIKECLEHLTDALAERMSVPVLHDLLDLVARVEAAYVAAKNRKSGLDFEDLQVKARNLLRDFPALQQLYQETWDVLMVDEYQDTNGLQDSLVRLLCPETATRKLFMVGDPKQSIYGFRGADVSVFMAWRERLASVCHLQSNYRSVPCIVDFVNAFFGEEVLAGQGGAGWQIRFGPDDGMKAERAGEGTIQVLSVERGQDELTDDARSREASLLADHIWASVQGSEPLRVADRPARWGDCAMLFRVTSQIKVYEHELRRRNIPYYVVKGQGFFECQEIKDVVNVLAWLDDPTDGISLAGFLRSPMVGLSDNALLRLAKGGGLAEGTAALDTAEEDAALARARAWLLEWRELRDRLAPSELVERIVRSTGYLAAIVPLFQGAQKVANVRKLVDLSREYEESGPYNFRGFVRYLTTLIDDKAREPEYPVWAERADVVRLMTVHQSKGLQFPIVYVPQMARENRIHPEAVMFHVERGVVAKVRVDKYHPWLKPPAMAAVEAERKDREIEESRRLLYVALTRAADHLVMSGEFGPRQARADTWAGWLRRWLGGDESAKGVRVMRRGDVPSAPEVQAEGAEPFLPAAVAEAETRVAGFSPAPPQWLVLSARELAEYLVCARRHYYVSVLSLEEMPPRARVAPPGTLPAADRGHLVHRVLEEIDFGSSAGDVQRALLRLVGGDTPELPRLGKDIQAFLASDTGQVLRQARQVAREVPLYLTLQDVDGWTLQVSGVADLIFQDADGEWHILDYKQSRLSRGRQSLYQYQLKLYAAALMAGTGVERVTLGLRFLEDRKSAPADVLLTAADARRLEAHALRAARQLAGSARSLTEEAWPKVTDESRCHDLSCGFRWRCGRLPEAKEQMELSLEL
jgi:ATP-dependent helicase/nuclease subunit A